MNNSKYKVEFEDIRLILSVQGYQLDYAFILREIGFWCREKSGCIPFNCKLNRNHLDSFNLKNINLFEEELHGIKLRKYIENGLPSSDSKSVLKCLYHMAKRNDYDSKYIGIFADECTRGLLSRAGLNNFVIDLENLEIFSRYKDSYPSLQDLRALMSLNPERFACCQMHDRLRNNEIPLCAQMKVESVAYHIQQIIKQHQHNHQHPICQDLDKQRQNIEVKKPVFSLRTNEFK